MKKRRLRFKFILVPLACLVLLASFGCTREEKYIGLYKVMGNSPPEFREMWMELQKGGKGVRRVHGEELFFEWEARGLQIRIHTKEGGILVAKMRNGILEITLPGSRVVRLQKVGEKETS